MSPIDWKRVAGERLRRIRALEHQRNYFYDALQYQLERDLCGALHARCVRNSVEIAREVAAQVMQIRRSGDA